MLSDTGREINLLSLQTHAKKLNSSLTRGSSQSSVVAEAWCPWWGKWEVLVQNPSSNPCASLSVLFRGCVRGRLRKQSQRFFVLVPGLHSQELGASPITLTSICHNKIKIMHELAELPSNKGGKKEELFFKRSHSFTPAAKTLFPNRQMGAFLVLIT